MALQVSSLPHLRSHLRAIEARPVTTRPLTAFFLFDERESHRSVARFVARQRSWLNSLARSANVVLYFFLPQDEAERLNDEKGEVLLVGAPEAVENPSLAIAARFGLTADDLPGVVFFTDLRFADREPDNRAYESNPELLRERVQLQRRLKRETVDEGVFWPLDIELFGPEFATAEQEFAKLFSILQVGRQGSTDASQLLEYLNAKIESLDESERSQPIFSRLRAGALKLVRAVGTIAVAMSVAFAQGKGAAWS